MTAPVARITPSPPRNEPGPPDPRRSSYRTIRSGNSSSIASIGLFRVLLMATCTALGPGASGHAP